MTSKGIEDMLKMTHLVSPNHLSSAHKYMKRGKKIPRKS
jgi:hypothetical protein